MAEHICNICIHEQICAMLSDFEYSADKCPFFMNAADVEPVVRCKDCKYWQDNNGGYPHDECRWGKGETPFADDFCSYGERSAV